MNDMQVTKAQEQLFRDYEKLLQESLAKALAGEQFNHEVLFALSDGIRLIRQIREMELGKVVAMGGPIH